MRMRALCEPSFVGPRAPPSRAMQRLDVLRLATRICHCMDMKPLLGMARPLVFTIANMSDVCATSAGRRWATVQDDEGIAPE